jgi:hypothetical protein
MSGDWISTADESITHCTYWDNDDRLNPQGSENFCGEMDCNHGTHRFTMSITGTRGKCNDVVVPQFASLQDPTSSASPPTGKLVRIKRKGNPLYLSGNNGIKSPMAFANFSDPLGWTDIWSFSEDGHGYYNLLQHSSQTTGFYASVNRTYLPMYSIPTARNEGVQLEWHDRGGGYFSLRCVFNGNYLASYSPGPMEPMEPYCNATWSEADHLYYESEKRGVWAAGVIQFDHHPLLGEKHRMIKLE